MHDINNAREELKTGIDMQPVSSMYKLVDEKELSTGMNHGKVWSNR